MKILFIQPKSINRVIENANHIYNFEPLGIYYLASLMLAEYEIDFLDLINESTDLGESEIVSNKIKHFNPGIIVFSALTSVRTSSINKSCKLIKNINSDIITIVGGPHAFLMPNDFNNDFIDFLVTKNSIPFFVQIISMLSKGFSVQQVKETITGSCLLEKSKLKELPIPHREIGVRYKSKYSIAIGKPGIQKIKEPISSIKTSSGCPFRCNFCCLWQLYPKYEKREVDPIIDELKIIETDYVFFADDESMIDMNFMNQLADKIIENNISKKYVMYSRVDSIVRNEKIIEKWAQVGFTQIWLGLEGCTDLQLKRYEKKNHIFDQEKAIKIARQYNISVHATALVDYTFSKSDFNRMLDYTKNHLGLTSCHFFILTPFRGTKYHSELIKSQPELFLTHNPDHYSIRQSVLKPEKMSIDEFHFEYAELQRKFNSDTIPFECNSFEKKEYEDEFKELKKMNMPLYENILNSHLEYETTSANNLITEYALY